MLDLAPEIETTVRDYAAREGVSIDESLARAFPPCRQPQSSAEMPEQTALRVQALLTKWQAQTGMPAQSVGSSKTLAELSAEWAIEDAHMSDKEVAVERAFWEDFERAIINSPGVSI